MNEVVHSRLSCCWGKTVEGTPQWHPVLHHMLDTGRVAQVLLGPDASPRWLRVLSCALGIDPDRVRELVPWLVALHDIGKISTPFQSQNAEQRARLLSEGFDLRPVGLQPPHSSIGGAVMGAWRSEPTLPVLMRELLRDVVAAHHGAYCSCAEMQSIGRHLRSREPAEWAVLRAAAARRLLEILSPGEALSELEPANVSAALAALCGFVTLCDWLGSNSEFFVPAAGSPIEEYAPLSAARAHAACAAAGFLAPTSSTAPAAFRCLFAGLANPRPLQLAVDAIPDEALTAPCLVVIEAPTGEGKTEAAWALAHRIAVATGSDDLYYALPTTATSNQMFSRLQRHLSDNLRLPTQAKLVHSQAFLVEDDLRLESLDGGDNLGRPALEWFGPRKRALLAPFGVGTIDQAELAALNVRHSPLRLVGLAGKVLIIDEVHAYDVYMTTVIERLLEWLSRLGTSVILLSATLPQQRRAALARAFTGRDCHESNWSAYPSLVVASDAGRHYCSPPAYQPSRTVSLKHLSLGDQDAGQKARLLLDLTADGGCACWITNTVRRAQQLFAELARLAGPSRNTMLLHSQFPLDQRQDLEAKLTSLYGPDGSRPENGIVVATQVLEQSLDLDLDVMVSDLAPVDLLLQRAGRLHRHRRPRPAAHASPVLYINVASAAGGAPDLTTDAYVYAEYILRQTCQVLAGRSRLDLPVDYRHLIECVYDAAPPEPDDALRKAWDKLQKEIADARQEARQRLVPAPNAHDSIADAAAGLCHIEDENGTGWIVARTRLGEDSLAIVPLERQGTQARLSPDGAPLDLNVPASREMELQLLRRSLRISTRPVVQALRKEMDRRPVLFTKSALLRDYCPLWLSGGQASLNTPAGNWQLVLDPALGLVTKKEGRD